MPTPKKPRCKLCGADRPLPYGTDTCEICQRVCPGCGRRIPYSGAGRPFDRCPDCREKHKAAVICPCGRRVPMGRRRYCTDHCYRNARRYARGRKTFGDWSPNHTTVESLEGDHAGAALVLAGHMRMVLKVEGNYRSDGDAIILDGRRKVFTVRHTRMAFDTTVKSLPKFLPMDDVPRYDATQKPERGYVLLNEAMSVAAYVPTGANTWSHIERHERWVPRYGSWEMWMMVPRDCVKLYDLRAKGPVMP